MSKSHQKRYARKEFGSLEQTEKAVRLAWLERRRIYLSWRIRCPKGDRILTAF
jgi:hypothetical protein